ncbi:sensor histidine kinase [Robinsoniella peoriensis]|uniref:sensor histidine kinase n=1 Tax=Robinsoniella peoriensis TaxID=180332 RepID=UPI00085C299F|nr:histidine kinase [Robinsoniella peoriensis]
MENQSQNTQKPRSLKSRMLFFIMLCWVIPLLVLFVFMVFSYRNEILEKSEMMLNLGIENVTSTLSQRIDEAITASKKPSYEGVCEKAWRKYRKGETNKNQFYQDINNELKSKFYIDKKFSMFTFYLEGDDEPLCYSANNEFSYLSYMEQIHGEMRDLIEGHSSDAVLRVVDGRIYIVRNMYTVTKYIKFGTLIVELNQDQLFRNIQMDLSVNAAICFNDGEEFVLVGNQDEDASLKYFPALFQKYDKNKDDTIQMDLSNSYKGYLKEKKCRDYNVGVAFLVSKALFYESLYNLYKIIACIILILIPVLMYGVKFLNKQVSIPVSRMIRASEAIEEGQLGTVVEGENMPNAEFSYLMDSFNRMSKQVKYLFDYAYDEKLARRDAKIMALQAQINPHFLNNTLEMMNWQARMSGDTTISKMIESLSTVLDYRMDRAGSRLINLAEELHCADAYFYIISMRFGKRLKVEWKVDDSLLQVKVPRLILQPLLENAVVHGIEQVKNGIIEIQIFHDETKIYVKVFNSGKPMTREDMEKINAILSGSPGSIKAEPGQHTSLGIRNVNERIKLIYGAQYGLSITPGEDGKTESVITLPYEKELDKEEEINRQKAQKELQSTGKIGE